MKAVSYEGVHQVAVKDHPKPKLQKPTDAVLRVTTSGICGIDLHMYDGRTPLKSGTVVGHEIMGVIDEIGEAVQSIKKGDRVVLPFNISCGFCFNCHRGHTEACLTANPEQPHAAYGYAGMGPIKAAGQSMCSCRLPISTASSFQALRATSGKMISCFSPMFSRLPIMRPNLRR